MSAHEESPDTLAEIKMLAEMLNISEDAVRLMLDQGVPSLADGVQDV